MTHHQHRREAIRSATGRSKARCDRVVTVNHYVRLGTARTQRTDPKWTGGTVKRTRRISATVASLAVVALVAAACGGSSDGNGSKKNAAAPEAGRNDVNAVPRDQVADGGTFRWPLAQIPSNFNLNELDGSLQDGARVMNGMMPAAFLANAEGTVDLNKDLLTNATLTSTDPQVVTYTINPKAKWSDGTNITAEDFIAQWKALNGTNPAYNVSSTNGYDQIGSVKQGKDDHEAVATFKNKYADWKGIFGPLYPASTNNDPKVFNEGWLQKPLVTAGPFKFDSIDQTAKTITVVRDPSWWGTPAKLDKIIYRIVPIDSQVDSLANGELDYIDVGPDVNALQRAQGTPGIVIRRAGGPNFRHMTINGTGPILKDLNVRKAVAMGINRQAIAKALIGPLGVPDVPLNNHIFMTNQAGYKDNSGDVGKYNPDAAKKLLDDAGWKMDGQFRKKDGKELDLRFVIPTNVAASTQESNLIQGMLEDIGIKVNIESVPTQDLFDKHLRPGNFDLTVFSFIGTPFPISSSASIYVNPTKGPDGELAVQQNYARIGSPEIDKLQKDATAELDPTKATDLANQLDAAIWAEVHSLTTYQRPDIAAEKSTVVNFGAKGFADYDYINMGFKK